MPMTVRASAVREQFLQKPASFGFSIFHGGCGAGQRAQIAGEDSLGRTVNIQLFRSCRAITRRWISLVPSPMVQSLTSR